MLYLTAARRSCRLLSPPLPIPILMKPIESAKQQFQMDDDDDDDDDDDRINARKTIQQNKPNETNKQTNKQTHDNHFNSIMKTD